VTADSGGSVSVRKVIDIGPARTMQQDVEFGVIQIVDIALRAISPPSMIPALRSAASINLVAF
jgi:uncharacterized membrane protein